MPKQTIAAPKKTGNTMTEVTEAPLVSDVKRAMMPSLWIMLGSCLIFSLGLFLLLGGNYPIESRHLILPSIGFSLSGGLGLIAATLGLISFFKRRGGETLVVLEEDSRALESRHGSAFWIAFAAALGLFLELMLVRMHGNSVQLFAYYKNVSLMSCFLGLGIGYSLNKSKPLTLAFFLPMVSLELLFLNVMRWADLSYLLRNPAKEQATFEIYLANTIADFMISLGFIVTVFVFNTLVFVPLGQLASQLMSKKSSLYCYSWNLVGSLAGIVLFALLSFLWMPPAMWMAISALGVLLFLRKEKSLIPSVFAACFAVGMLAMPVRAFLFQPLKYDIYSPYQILTVNLDHSWPKILANNTWLQQIVNLKPEMVRTYPDQLGPIAAAYGLPYRYQPNPGNVLIVGSGTGNDIAAAIRGGAKDIDAVEIDPGIIQIGSSMHPEHPYSHSQVHIINDDARHYIRHCKKKYDLIIYGYLDSTSTLTANSGGVRMDSYVWTEEGFKEARALLKPDGIVCCTVCILPELTHKVFRMLEQAFDGRQAIVYNTKWDSGYTFILGNKEIKALPDEDLSGAIVGTAAVSKESGSAEKDASSTAANKGPGSAENKESGSAEDNGASSDGVSAEGKGSTTLGQSNGAATKQNVVPFKDLTKDYIANKEPVDIATDDWPFLWMFKRSYPVSYALVIGLLTIISVFMVKKFLPAKGTESTNDESGKFSWPCFFLGAGFMLVETKGITELALVWGSTWFVTSIVVAAVIILAFLANLVVSKTGKTPTVLSYICLFLTLAAGFALSYYNINFKSLGGDLERIVMTLLLTSPLFFSGLAFSSELKKSGSISIALSSNLLGGMLGGFVEYNSLFFGYRSLYLFALAMYVLALIASLKSSTPTAPES